MWPTTLCFIYPLTTNCGIFSRKEMSHWDLLHRWISPSPWKILIHWKIFVEAVCILRQLILYPCGHFLKIIHSIIWGVTQYFLYCTCTFNTLRPSLHCLSNKNTIKVLQLKLNMHRIICFVQQKNDCCSGSQYAENHNRVWKILYQNFLRSKQFWYNHILPYHWLENNAMYRILLLHSLKTNLQLTQLC